MKTIIIGITAFAIFLIACGDTSHKSGDSSKINDNTNKSSDSTQQSTQAKNQDTKKLSSVSDLVAGYLQLKNALANDNGSDAASAGKTIMNAVDKFDRSSLSAGQKKFFEDAAGDIEENAEHISENSNKIAHQREHFEMLSSDLYDLVKTFGAGQTLYYDHCPMYNDKKGADWISETKEIKNPYMGKKMPTCGSVKEELK